MYSVNQCFFGIGEQVQHFRRRPPDRGWMDQVQHRWSCVGGTSCELRGAVRAEGLLWLVGSTFEGIERTCMGNLAHDNVFSS